MKFRKFFTIVVALVAVSWPAMGMEEIGKDFSGLVTLLKAESKKKMIFADLRYDTDFGTYVKGANYTKADGSEVRIILIERVGRSKFVNAVCRLRTVQFANGSMACVVK